jgi:hypothetical protein
LIKESHPNHSPTDSNGDHGWNRYWHQGISSSVYTYQKLSREFINDIEWVLQSLEALQDEVDSLASAVLQNRHTLDLLTAGKGGNMPFSKGGMFLY